MVRVHRSSRNTEGDYHTAPSRDRQDHRAAGHHGENGDAWLRCTLPAGGSYEPNLGTLGASPAKSNTASAPAIRLSPISRPDHLSPVPTSGSNSTHSTGVPSPTASKNSALFYRAGSRLTEQNSG